MWNFLGAGRKFVWLSVARARAHELGEACCGKSPIYSKTILNHLDHSRRNVVEFRHASWWNEDVFAAFRKTGTIFCSCSAPRLPDMLVRTAWDIYIRFHGTKRWYRHDYSSEELANWAAYIKASGAKTSWIYFNNDYNAYSTRNARQLGPSIAMNQSRARTFETVLPALAKSHSNARQGGDGD